MDIARLLNRDDSDLSDAEPITGVVWRPSPSAPTSPVPVASPAPRRRRRLRKPTIESLRAQVEAFESIVANLPTVVRQLEMERSNSRYPWRRADQDDEQDEITEAETGSADAQRMRVFLRATIVLMEQRERELAARAELRAMLVQHYESSASLRRLMRGLSLDSWHWACERWRLLTREYYKPLHTSECYALVQDTLQTMDAFTLPPRATRNASFFGWRDAQIVVQKQGYVHFLTRKTQPHGAIQETADDTWSIYQDGQRYKQCQLGDNCELFHQILQRVTDDIVVMQTVEQYRGMAKNIHSVSIVFRVATESGYLVAVRSTHPRELEGVMQCDGLAIGDNLFWCQWDITQRDGNGQCTEFQSTIAGHIGADYDGYARWWVTELVLALVRAETNMGASLLSLGSGESKNNKQGEAP